MPYEVELINTGNTVAKYVDKFLKDNNMQNNLKKDKEIIYLTKSEENFKSIARNILKYDIKIKEI
jgi:glutamate racemase